MEIAKVTVPTTHRQVKPWLLAELVERIRKDGFNPAYPIVVEQDGTLVEGRHRLEAAKAVGIKNIPHVFKPDNVGRVRFGLQCNADGQMTAADDVFDLAELCWTLATVEGWTGQQIADELGWSSTGKVSQISAIKNNLHPAAWAIARFTTKTKQVNTDDDNAVNQFFTTVNWTERSFRSFLSALPCPNGDRATMRAQVAAIRELMAGDKLTAKVAGQVAERFAWYTKLARLMTETLPKEVGVKSRKMLIRDIRNNVYGKFESDRDAERFNQTLSALAEKALGVKLYQGDSLRFIPAMEDKSISLVVTDPPYNTTDYEWDQFGTREEFMAWMAGWLTDLRPKMADEHHLFLFCDPDYMADVEMMLRGLGWPIKSRIIWEYRNLVKGRDVTDKFIENYQVCFHCGTHALNWPPDWDDRRFMVQTHATPQSNFKEGKHHPTAKPINLIRLMVEIGSKPGDLVFDPFAGGGTTGAACVEVGSRRAILVEQSDLYSTAIEKRLGIKRGDL